MYIEISWFPIKTIFKTDTYFLELEYSPVQHSLNLSLQNNSFSNFSEHFMLLSLQQKYFDSGDYNMAKAKIKNKQLPTAAPEKTEITGDHIPTPQDLPQRKPSLVASKLAG